MSANSAKGTRRRRAVAAVSPLSLSGNKIPQVRPAVDRLLTVDIRTGRIQAVACETMDHQGVAHGDHHQYRFLPALPQASRCRGMTSYRHSRMSSPWGVSRPQNWRPLILDLRRSVPPYSRNRSIPWFCSGGPGPPTARYRTAASRGPRLALQEVWRRTPARRRVLC
jgi:hypothetical protein